MSFFRRVRAGLSTTRSFRGAADARAYAVGDVHGRLDLLDQLLAQISAELAARPAPETFLIFLGDLIDRGPQSAEVVERLRIFADFPATPIFLMGNHEEIFLRTLAGEPNVAYNWLSFGGDSCAESYGLSAPRLELFDEARIADQLRQAVPASHIAFIEQFGDTFRFGDYLFVHAGIRPGVPVEQQDPHDLRWIRHPFLSDSKDHGVMVVHGHSIAAAVDERLNRIGIDTGAYQSGRLTAIAVEGEARWFLSTGG